MFQLLKKYRSTVMGFAALWIVAFHVSFPISQSGGVLTHVETVVKRFGFGGVDIFLFLSGMGLVYAIQKSSLPVFYARRIKRIIVPFMLMGILEAVLEGWSLQTFLRNIFFYNFVTQNIYSYLWYVPMIAILYFIFPLYFSLFRKSSNKIVFTLAVLILWLIVSLGCKDIIRKDVWGFTNRIPVFAVGILVGWISQRTDIAADRLIWFTIFITFILGAMLAYMTNFQDYYVLVPSSNCCVPTFLMAVSLSFLIPGVIDKLLSVGYLRWMGTILLKIFEFYGSITIELYCVQEYLVSKFLYPVLKGYLANVLWNIPLNGIILLILTVIAAAVHYIPLKLFRASMT